MRAKLTFLTLCALLALGALAQAETSQRGALRVSFNGKLSPHSLPREKLAPVRVSVATKIASAKAGTPPPQLKQIAIAINRYGVLDTKGIPVCQLEAIQPATTADALAACRRSLVGAGRFEAEVLLKGRAPFPSEGKLYAYNGEVEGKPAILAHVYGTEPAPASFTLTFLISHAKGTFATVLKAPLPSLSASSGYITGLSLNLGRTFSSHGQRHSYLSASCPAPKGFPGASFPFAKASLRFAKGPGVRQTLVRSCGVK